MAGALRGMGAVAAGLITATGLKLAAGAAQAPAGRAACAGFGGAAFVAHRAAALPLVWVLLGLGGLAAVLTWRRLGAVT